MKNQIDIAELEDPNGWIDVRHLLPDEDERVLAVKELKNGRREITIASCIPNYQYRNKWTGEIKTAPYWICIGTNRNIIYWMPLPKLPGEEGNK